VQAEASRVYARFSHLPDSLPLDGLSPHDRAVLVRPFDRLWKACGHPRLARNANLLGSSTAKTMAEVQRDLVAKAVVCRVFVVLPVIVYLCSFNSCSAKTIFVTWSARKTLSLALPYCKKIRATVDCIWFTTCYRPTTLLVAAVALYRVVMSLSRENEDYFAADRFQVIFYILKTVLWPSFIHSSTVAADACGIQFGRGHPADDRRNV
jgi:hypothetical protein